MHPGTETEPFRSVLHAEGTETSKSLPNIVLGPMKVIGCDRVKKFIRSSEAETVHSGTETPVLPRFPCSRYPNGRKHSQASFRAQASGLEVSVAKNPFRSSLLRGSASGHRKEAVSLRFALEGTETLQIDEDIDYGTRTSTLTEDQAPESREPPSPAPEVQTPEVQAPFPPGPITRARARELNYIMLLKNQGPEE